MSWKVSTSRVVLIAVLAASGCRQGGEDSGESSLLRSNDLVGTWGDGYESLEYQSNGTFVDMSGDEGSWSIEDGMIAMSYREVDEEDGCTFTEEMGYSVTSAIVNGVLYMPVYVRTGGSEDGADGTWEYRRREWGEATDRCAAYSDSMWQTEEYRVRITITGDTFESEEFMYDAAEYGEESWDDTWTETSKGTVRVDGDAVHIRVTEIDGSPASEEEQYESLFGVRISSEVIMDSSWSDNPEDLGFQRQ